MTEPAKAAPLDRAHALLQADPAEHVDWPQEADAAVALGWDLKAACYACWNSEPTLAERAAALLADLAGARAPPVLHALAQ